MKSRMLQKITLISHHTALLSTRAPQFNAKKRNLPRFFSFDITDSTTRSGLRIEGVGYAIVKLNKRTDSERSSIL